MKFFLALLFVTNTAMASMPDSKSVNVTPDPYAVLFKSLTAEQYGELRGKKLNFMERMAYNSARKKAMQTIKADEEPTERKFSWLGFVLGLIFPYGLIASFFFKDRNVRRSALLGSAVALLVAGIILLSYASKL